MVRYDVAVLVSKSKHGVMSERMVRGAELAFVFSHICMLSLKNVHEDQGDVRRVAIFLQKVLAENNSKQKCGTPYFLRSSL